MPLTFRYHQCRVLDCEILDNHSTFIIEAKSQPFASALCATKQETLNEVL